MRCDQSRSVAGPCIANELSGAPLGYGSFHLRSVATADVETAGDMYAVFGSALRPAAAPLSERPTIVPFAAGPAGLRLPCVRGRPADRQAVPIVRSVANPTAAIASGAPTPYHNVLQFRRRGLLGAGSMRKPPTEWHRAIAQRRLEGKTLTGIATEFATSADLVRQAIRRVQDYDRGIAMLREDPASIEALDLIGRLPSHARRTLAARGITRITDLTGTPIIEMLTWPNIGHRSATMLLRLLDEFREASAKSNTT